MSHRRSVRSGWAAIGAIASLVLSGCASEPDAPAPTTTKQPATKADASKKGGAKPGTAGTFSRSAPIQPGSRHAGAGGSIKGAKDAKASTAKASTAKAAPAKGKAVDLPPPTYAEIAKEYNERASRLKRLWARAVVSVDYTDEQGKRRWEQGEGHLQVIQPSSMALSAGKLGEVVLWIGCDDQRYWFIDAKEGRRAWTGRHGSATREKIESLGMPAAPRDLLGLTGMIPLPPASDPRRAPSPRWSRDRSLVVFDVARAGATWRYHVSPRTYEPARIEILDASTGDPVLSASLDRYENVTIRGEGRAPPRVASRMRCLHHSSGSTLGLSISDMVDGGTGKLRPENFRFDDLAQRLGITDITDVDARRDRMTPPGAASR